MKRFSKIFCVALVAIVFGMLATNNTVFAVACTPTSCTGVNPYLSTETITYTECAEGAAAISASKLIGTAISGPPPNYCYSSSVTLIISLYQSLGYFFGGRYDRTVMDMNSQILSAVKSQPTGLTEAQIGDFKQFKDAYEQFSSVPPKDETFVGNTYTKILGQFSGTRLKALIGTGVQSAVAEDLIASSGFANLNEGICDNIVKSSLIFNGGAWLKEVLALFNCWIIALISKVVGWGVDLMSLLIEPGFWGGISINPAVTAGFAASIELVNIIFSVALVIMAIGTILNLKSYKINESITRFIIVALLINFTLVIAGSILDLANYLSLFFLNLTAKSAGGGIVTAWMGIFSGITNRVHDTGSALGVLLITILINILLLIAMIWAFGSIIISLFKRGFMLIVLLIISPFAVVSSLLPGKGVDQWKKWKDAFLKYTFYGVYVTAGLYLGTVMLLSLCESLNTTALAAHPEMSFMSGLMVPIMAAGFLIYIVLLADELAGGSAKATAAGASKLALGLAGGAALAGATGIVTKIGTSKQVSELATNLSKKGGLSAALGTRLSSFKQTSQSKQQEKRKIVEAQLATMAPDAYKDKIGNLLEKTRRHERLGTNDQIYLAAGLNALPGKQRRALSPDAQAAIPEITDDLFKAGILTKPEQKIINATVPSLAGIYSITRGIEKAGGIRGNPIKVKQAIADDLDKVVDPVKGYRGHDENKKDNPIKTLQDINRCITQDVGATEEEKLLGPKLLESLVLKNTAAGFCNMIDYYSRSDDFNGVDGEDAKATFFNTLATYFVDQSVRSPRGSVEEAVLSGIAELIVKSKGTRAVAFRSAANKELTRLGLPNI